MSVYGDKIVDAISKSSHRTVTQKREIAQRFPLLLFAVFVVVLLLALMTGARSYGSLVQMQATNDEHIMTVGPIVSAVRANDLADSLSVGPGPEGDALVLSQSDLEGTYETRLYLYQGQIMQEYALATTPYNPQKATPLAESSTFEFDYVGGLLVINTDEGEIHVALRSQLGGE